MWVPDSLDFEKALQDDGTEVRTLVSFNLLYTVCGIFTKSHLGRFFPHCTVLYNVEFCNHSYIKFKYITETFAFLFLL